ncbi:acyl-CoA N-acyltransferase [Lindgomyces ingoldianus]|uniref:Acyl-CoA N-acyltransferase n=1 Tax=Lindgomyces ingoldianus TaxID=673940 RepID=A0ACB6RH63_9PLEO|nr:acyl-CoA N-acyltransferase [Lindgomyces ingoldianus]KAF2478075.1 acyl-CoA N-acyltransferase [Lindgomyces ingoldianus]
MVVVDPSIIARSERLLIRPLVMDDAEDIVLMRSNPEVMKHTPLKPTNDIEKSKEWIQGCHDRENCWNFCIELLPSSSSSSSPTPTPTPITGPRVIGMIGAVRAPEVGYMLNHNYWGKGIATEALRAFMPLFWNHYSGGKQGRFEYAEAHTDPELVSSQNVLKKAGFELFEVREKDFENPILGLRDTMVFRMVRPGSGNGERAPAAAS